MQQWELGLLQIRRNLGSRERELKEAAADLASEHFKLEAVLSLFEEQAVIALDTQGKLIFLSPSGERLLGRPEGQLLDRSLLDFLEEQEELTPEIFLGSQSRHITCRLRGEEKDLKLSIFPTYSGDQCVGCLVSLAPPLPISVVAPQGELYGLRVVWIGSSRLGSELETTLQKLGCTILRLGPDDHLEPLERAAESGFPWDIVLTDLDAPLQGYRSLEGTALLRLTSPLPVGELKEVILSQLSPSVPTAIYPAVPEAGPVRLKVLVAEDEPINRMLVEECVKEAGFAVVCASDGQEAWDLYQEGDYHVVISDWLMPVMGGPELCQRVREHPGRNYTYFIILSGKKESDDAARVIAECGADDYLVKPLNPSEILRRLQVAQRIADQHAKSLMEFAPRAR